MILSIAKVIMGYIEVMQKSLTIPHHHERIVQVCLSGAKGFYFRSLEHHAGFELILDKIIVIRFFVIADQFFTHDV